MFEFKHEINGEIVEVAMVQTQFYEPQNDDCEGWDDRFEIEKVTFKGVGVTSILHFLDLDKICEAFYDQLKKGYLRA